MSPSGFAAARYGKLVGITLATLVVLAAVGYFPTRRLAGSEGLAAMLAGCGITLLATAIGMLPMCWPLAGSSSAPLVSILASTGLRLMAALALGVAAALSGYFQPAPLLIWMAISYLLMLLVDTPYAVRTQQRSLEAGRQKPAMASPAQGSSEGKQES